MSILTYANPLNRGPFFKMTRINIVLENEVHKKAKINSIKNNITLIEYVNNAIEEKLIQEKNKKII